MFTASDNLAHLAAYEQACEHDDGGEYLRREDIMGKAHALLETLSDRADSDEQRKKRWPKPTCR